jgi:phosphatidylglycerol---prolipoprotein diacylglyceryl transferase
MLFALPFPAIDPVLIEFGPIVVRWYALAYIVGLVLGWAIARRLVAAKSLWREPPGDPALLDDLLVWVAFGVIIGGRLGQILLYEPSYYAAHPLEIVQVWHGGMAFHGGLVGAGLAIIVFARRHGIPVLSYLDLVSVVAPIGLFLGRIANFVNGELWGRVTDVPWAVIFPRAGPEPRHPSQLYEAGLEGICLLLVLAIVVRLGALKRPGLVTGLFGIGYALARMVAELFREPDGIVLGPITTGQALSLPLLLIGLVLIWHAVRTRPAQ